MQNVRSPITDEQLEKIDPSHGGIQFEKLLSESDFQKLSLFLEKYPDSGIRVYGNYDKSINNLSFLRFFPNIKKFYIDLWELSNFDDLSYLSPDLLEFGIGQTKSKTFSIKTLERFQKLESLYLDGHTKDFDSIGKLANLKSLTLRSITLPNLELLEPLSQLLSLDIKLGGTKNLKSLPRVGKLKYLELWQILGLDDISLIEEIDSLQYLFLQTLKHIKQLPNLGNLPSLRRVHLETMKGIKDLSPLKDAPALEELLVIDMPQLISENFSSLVGHPTLKAITIGTGSLKKNDKIKDMFKLPKVESGKQSFIFR